MMEVGIKIEGSSDNYGAALSRKVVYTSTWLGWFAKAYQDKVVLNVNYSQDQGSFARDLDSFCNKLLTIKYKLKPYLICIQNEADLQLQNFNYYLAELSASATTMGVINSGFTQQSLGYFYYSMTGDADFFKYNINQKELYNQGAFAYEIGCIKRELDIIKYNQNIIYVNVHYYIGSATQEPGLIRMFNWVSANYKQVMCNEAGIYHSGLLSSVVNVARQCNMPYLILYSGTGIDGSGKSFPISNLDFINAIQ